MTATAQKQRDSTLNIIPADNVISLVPAMSDFLMGLVERSGGRWTAAGIIEKWTSGEWQLWVIWDGSIQAIMATQIYVEMSGMRICSIKALTGHDSLQWLHLVDELEAWAKHQSCSVIEGVMRRGWAKRLSEYRMSHVVLEKDLI